MPPGESKPSSPAQVLAELRTKFPAQSKPGLNEAETRLLIIDRVLDGVLGWALEDFHPESHEPADEEGAEWLDYHLEDPEGAKLVVEAKRTGKTFYLSTTRRTRKYSLNALRSAHGPEVAAAIKQALRYCGTTGTYSFMVTNGVQWVGSIAFWPHANQSRFTAVVFHDLDDIAANLEEFIDCFSSRGLRNNHLLNVALAETILVPSFAATLNARQRSNPQVNRNYLVRPLESLMRECFDDLVGDVRAEMFRFCYVTNELTDGYCARLENFVGNTLPLELSKATKVDRAKFSRAPDDSHLSRAMQRSGEALLLVGRVGSGKTTFLEYALNHLRQNLGDPSWVLLRLDLLSKTQIAASRFNHDTFLSDISRELLQQAEKEYPTLSPFLYENLKGIFSADIARGLSSLPPQLRDSAAADRLMLEVCDREKRNLQSYLINYLSYLTRNRSMAVTVILDNIDRGTEEFEKVVFLFARQLSRDTGATTVTALRDITYHRGRQSSLFDTSQNIVFTISPPPFLSVASKRIDYTVTRLDSDRVLLDRIERSLGTFPLRRVLDFVEVLSEIVLGENHDIQEFIQNIAGTDVRRALELLRLFSTSGNTDVDGMLKDYNRRFFGQPLEIFLRSIMRGDNARYQEAMSPVINLFQADTKKLVSHFTALRVLGFLAWQAERTRAEPDVSLGEIVSTVGRAGHSAAAIRDVVNQLGRFALVASRSHPEPPWPDDAIVRIGGGHYYLTRLVHEKEYLANVVDDTVIYDRDTLDTLVWLHEDKQRPFREKRETKLEVFLSYLYRREAEELLGAGSGESRPPWLVPIIEPLMTQLWGARRADELKQGRAPRPPKGRRR